MKSIIKRQMREFVNDAKHKLQIRTMIIHTFKEEGLQVINEFNYFLHSNNLGNILFYKLLNNH